MLIPEMVAVGARTVAINVPAKQPADLLNGIYVSAKLIKLDVLI